MCTPQLSFPFFRLPSNERLSPEAFTPSNDQLHFLFRIPSSTPICHQPPLQCKYDSPPLAISGSTLFTPFAANKGRLELADMADRDSFLHGKGLTKNGISTTSMSYLLQMNVAVFDHGDSTCAITTSSRSTTTACYYTYERRYDTFDSYRECQKVGDTEPEGKGRYGFNALRPHWWGLSFLTFHYSLVCHFLIVLSM